MAVAIRRTEHSVSALREAASRTRDAAQARRGVLSYIRQPPSARQLRRHHADALSERHREPRSAHQPGGKPARKDNHDPACLAMASLPALTARSPSGSAKRVGTLTGRTRRIAIVAMARKLLIALWRYAETGVLPAPVELRAEAAAAA